MGVSFKRSQVPCGSSQHRFMRYESARGTPRLYAKPVLLREPMESDFCAHCGRTRGELGLMEVTV